MFVLLLLGLSPHHRVRVSAVRATVEPLSSVSMNKECTPRDAVFSLFPCLHPLFRCPPHRTLTPTLLPASLSLQYIGTFNEHTEQQQTVQDLRRALQQQVPCFCIYIFQNVSLLPVSRWSQPGHFAGGRRQYLVVTNILFAT